MLNLKPMRFKNILLITLLALTLGSISIPSITLAFPPDDAFCTTGDPLSGIQTALGCLSIDTKTLVSSLLKWAAGIGAGIAFLIIVYGGFQIATAAGDPKRVKGGQELIATALGALALIVLAVVALNFVGVTILDLSGLGFNV